MIGSIMRVDSKVHGIQVIVIANSKILATQIAAQYKKLVQFTSIKAVDATEEPVDGAHVIVTTLGKLKALLDGRKKPNMKEMKVIIFDEADFYFSNENDVALVKSKIVPALPKKVQYILFSATFPDEAKEVISDFVKEAKSIALKNDKLSLENLVQYRVDLPKAKKIDFLTQLHGCCKITQCIVFVNTRKFAIKIVDLLREKGFKAHIVFGKGMMEDERKKVIEKFREGSVNFLITTDIISRGFDVSTVKLVVNFDVPQNKNVPDPANYMHRIGRAGRFGTKACAVTLIDRPEDKECMDKIIEYYSIQDKVHQLENPEIVAGILRKFVEEDQQQDD